MAAFVSVGNIIVGSGSNCTGVFNGQNMQNNWDSHAPLLSCSGGSMGNHCISYATIAYLWNTSHVNQALADQDVKVNGCPMLVGP